MAVSAVSLEKAAGFTAIIPAPWQLCMLTRQNMHPHYITTCEKCIYTDWILSICYIVPEGMEYIRQQGGVYEIYCPLKTA